MKDQNIAIQAGIDLINAAAKFQAKKDNVLRSLGWGAASQYSANFIDWIYYTRTSLHQFKSYIQQATVNKAYKEYPYLHYDSKGDILELQLNEVHIYFESIYFEDYVGAQEVNLGTFDFPILTWITAREYLQHNWESVAKGYIMDNLFRAEIEDSEIEELLND